MALRKACPANDVAAAQGALLGPGCGEFPIPILAIPAGDLKKLNLSQLLALRILTKDFPTTSVGSWMRFELSWELKWRVGKLSSPPACETWWIMVAELYM